MTLLTCEKLSKSFERQKILSMILNSISFDLDAGERILITGKSGAGKSVLLSLISGMDRPSDGDILFNGKAFNSLSENELNRLRIRDIGLIFQNLNLISSWTVLENVEAGMIGLFISRQERQKLAIEWLENVGLKNHLNHLPEHLSLGEQQRVAIVRTLICKPRLIVADEPTGDLDDETAEIIIGMLNDAVQKEQAAIVIATHGNYPHEQADRVFRLEGGALIDLSCNSQT